MHIRGAQTVILVYVQIIEEVEGHIVIDVIFSHPLMYKLASLSAFVTYN